MYQNVKLFFIFNTFGLWIVGISYHFVARVLTTFSILLFRAYPANVLVYI